MSNELDLYNFEQTIKEHGGTVETRTENVFYPAMGETREVTMLAVLVAGKQIAKYHPDRLHTVNMSGLIGMMECERQ